MCALLLPARPQIASKIFKANLRLAVPRLVQKKHHFLALDQAGHGRRIYLRFLMRLPLEKGLAAPS
jgi:hypothetical protein